MWIPFALPGSSQVIIDVTRASQQAPQFPEVEDDIILMEGTELNTTVAIIEAEDGDSKPQFNWSIYAYWGRTSWKYLINKWLAMKVT